MEMLTTRVRGRARRDGLPFDIDAEYLESIAPAICPVLGFTLDYGPKRLGLRVDNSPSLDRLIPRLGYVKGNIAVISWRANRLRSDATAEELARVLEYARSIVASPRD